MTGSNANEVQYDWETCLCYELGHQLCTHYENWCDEMAGQEWWNGLTEEEKESFQAIESPKPEVTGEEDWPF